MFDATETVNAGSKRLAGLSPVEKTVLALPVAVPVVPAASAAAAVSAATASAAAAVSAATASAAAAATVSARAGDVDRYRATANLFAVEAFDCSLSLFFGCHLNETEASRFAGESVFDNRR